MKRRILVVLIVGFFLIPLFSPTSVEAMTGYGTEEEPYIIWTLDDLQAMANNSPYEDDAYYKLGGDINASATTGWNWNAGRGVYEGFLPRVFEGHFDGDFYTIDGLYVDRYSTGQIAVGLFATFGDTAPATVTVQNLFITNADITGKSSCYSCMCCAGILAGGINYDGDDAVVEIYQVFVSGYVSATLTDTGIPGHSPATAGGLIGWVYEGDAIIEKCAAYANVEARGLNEARAVAGGFVGSYGTYYGSTSLIKNCYARGDATADCTDSYPGASAGGFIGYYYPKDLSELLVENVYSTGIPLVIGDINPQVGGLLVLATGNCDDVSACFWDKDTSGETESGCGTGKTTAWMKTESTFTDAGWDFVDIWDMEGDINSGYPYLQFTRSPGWPQGWTLVLRFEPNYIIDGTTLVDREGTQNGVITWGTNVNLAIDVGPIVSPDPPGVTPPDIVPDLPDLPLYPEPDPVTGLPWWDLISPAAVGLGWSTNTFYGILYIFVAIAIGVGVMIATGSALLAAVGVGVGLAVAASTGTTGWWILIVFVIFVTGYLVTARSM